MSTDNIGMNYDYPEAGYERRREIVRAHEIYQKGWLYFIANDPRVPKDVQERMRKWGLPKDEFRDNGGWPHQLYIREARRMVGHYVMTEHELLKKRPTPASVGMGSYTIDSHNVQRYITILFAISGALSGLGGVISASRIGVGTGNLGTGLEFDVITAVVVGGTSIFGGIGSLPGTLAGGLLIGVASGLTAVFFPAASEAVIYVMMAVVLLLRPRGLFGEEGMMS